MDRVDLTAVDREDAVEERPGLVDAVEHHQDLSAHRGQPDLDIEAQRLAVEFDDLVRPVGRLDVHLQRFRQMTREPQSVTQHGLERDLDAGVVAVVGDRLGLADLLDIFVGRAAIGEDSSVGGVDQGIGPHVARGQRQSPCLVEIDRGLLGRHSLAPAEVHDLAAGHHPQIVDRLRCRLVRQQFAHLLPASQGLARIIGADPDRRAHILLRRLQGLAGLFEVIGQQRRPLVGAILEQILDGAGHHRMQLAAAFVQQRAVGNLLDQRMAKRQQPLLERRHIV